MKRTETEQNKTTVWVFTKTLALLRAIAAHDNRSIVATVHRLAVQEWRRVEKRKGE